MARHWLVHKGWASADKDWTFLNWQKNLHLPKRPNIVSSTQLSDACKTWLVSLWVHQYLYVYSPFNVKMVLPRAESSWFKWPSYDNLEKLQLPQNVRPSPTDPNLHLTNSGSHNFATAWYKIFSSTVMGLYSYREEKAAKPDGVPVAFLHVLPEHDLGSNLVLQIAQALDAAVGPGLVGQDHHEQIRLCFLSGWKTKF